MYTKTDLAWAAGFIDADGTITLKRWKRNGKVYYQPWITVTQVAEYETSVQKLQDMFGGNIHGSHPAHRLPVLQWAVVSKQAIACAKLLLPYLIVKKYRAELVLKFEPMLIERKKQYRLSEANQSEREQLWELIRAEHRKGTLRLQRLSELGSNKSMQQSEHEL